jgi:hypothetical protein
MKKSWGLKAQKIQHKKSKIKTNTIKIMNITIVIKINQKATSNLKF